MSDGQQAPAGNDSGQARRMSFWQHLGELRTRIFRSVLYIALAGCAGWFFRTQIIDLLVWPLHRSHPEMDITMLGVQDAFMLYVRIAMYAGIVAASPLVLLELWGFIAPALKPQERRLVMPVLPVVLLLFSAGVLFIYCQLVPASVEILIGFSEQFDVVLTGDKYFNFVLGLCMAGGFMFEMPVVLGLLGWLGLVDARMLLRHSNVAIVVLLFISAVVTPTGDAFTMFLFTLPLLLLYFVSIVAVWLIERRAKRISA